MEQITSPNNWTMEELIDFLSKYYSQDFIYNLDKEEMINLVFKIELDAE